jgi:NADH-quinone oxidoreductase subunit F
VQLLHRFEAGTASEGDVDKMLDVCDNIGGKSFCALADGAVACVTSAVRHFRTEFEAGYTTPAWELFPYRESALFDVREREEATV